MALSIYNKNAPKEYVKKSKDINAISFTYFENHFYDSAIGVYKRFGDIGLKIYKKRSNCIGSFGFLDLDGFHIDELQSSNCWRRAEQEFNLLCKAQPLGLSPVPIVIKPIKIQNDFYPGVIMEHIVGEENIIFTKEQDKEFEKNKLAIEEFIGYYLDDHDVGNAIMSNGQIYFIDFEGLKPCPGLNMKLKPMMNAL